MPPVHPDSVRFARIVIRVASALVPETRRDEWQAEWDAELAHWAVPSRSSQALLRRALGAVPDALSLRALAVGSAWQGEHLGEAVRVLGRAPLATTLAVVASCLALGAGASLLSAARALRAGPAAPRGTVLLEGPFEAVGTGLHPMSDPELAALQTVPRAFQRVSAWKPAESPVIGAAGPRLLWTGAAAPGVFEILGRRALLGRWIEAPDLERGAAPVVVLSHGTWWTEFDGDRTVPGKSWTIGGVAHRIVGVAPPGWAPPGGDFIAAWVPLHGSGEWDHREDLLLARLAPGVDVAAAQDAVDRFASEFPEPGRRGLSGTRVIPAASRHSRVPLALAAAGLACAGLLVLVTRRAAAVVGGGPCDRVARHLLDLLAIVLAIPVSRLVHGWIADLLPASAPLLEGARADPRLVLVLAVIARLIRGGARAADSGRVRWPLPELAAGVALLALCVHQAAGPLAALRKGPGFPDRDLVALDVVSPASSTARLAPLASRRMSECAPACAVGTASIAPLGPGRGSISLFAGNASPARDVTYRFVDEGFFRALGVPLRGAAPGPRGVVVNEHLAASVWSHADPIGRTVLVPDVGTLVVTGVVPDLPSPRAPGEPLPEIFLDWQALPDSRLAPPARFTLLVRTPDAAERVESEARATLGAAVPELVVQGSRTVEHATRESVAPLRGALALVVLTATFALCLGLLSMTAAMRTRSRARAALPQGA